MGLLIAIISCFILIKEEKRQIKSFLTFSPEEEKSGEKRMKEIRSIFTSGQMNNNKINK